MSWALRQVANLTVADLRQVASGFYPLRDWQVRALARHMRLLDAELGVLTVWQLNRFSRAMAEPLRDSIAGVSARCRLD